MSLVDANLNDQMLLVILSTLHTIKVVLGDKFVIKGLNFNGNYHLTDMALKGLVQFSKDNTSIKVLSVEKFKVSYQGLSYLFSELKNTKIIELNISGIPVNFLNIESLCDAMKDSKRPALRVLHLRNTKL